MHKGGFVGERIAEGAIRITWPDGHVIDEHRQLPLGGGIDRFRDSNSGKGNPPIDASDWVIPEAVMDFELAVSGLIRLEQAKSSLVERRPRST